MNYRQLKKQYKRKHGFNPPKGYSRKQIRRGIKLNQWQNSAAVSMHEVAQGFKIFSAAVKEVAENFGNLAAALKATGKLEYLKAMCYKEETESERYTIEDYYRDCEENHARTLNKMANKNKPHEEVTL